MKKKWEGKERREKEKEENRRKRARTRVWRVTRTPAPESPEEEAMTVLLHLPLVRKEDSAARQETGWREKKTESAHGQPTNLLSAQSKCLLFLAGSGQRTTEGRHRKTVNCCTSPSLWIGGGMMHGRKHTEERGRKSGERRSGGPWGGLGATREEQGGK